MKNIALNMMTAFILSLLAVYWIPVIINLKSMNLPSPTKTLTKDFLENYVFDAKVIEMNYSKENFIAPIISSFSACNSTNICMLAEPLQNLLRTSAQKTQYLYVLRKLDERHLPQELALIPLIESQYNPYALSSRGAGGLWQLMPLTAKEHGILDHERFEIERSTDAALLLLNELHNEFGSWELALAAYNAGSKRVQNALAHNPQAKSIKDLRLPNQTKKYLTSFYHIRTYVH